MEKTSTMSNKYNTTFDEGDIQTWTMVKLPSNIKSKIQNILKCKIKKDYVGVCQLVSKEGSQ